MTTLQKEKSIQESRPYELFRFVYGPLVSQVATYTTKLTPVTYNTETYRPLPVDREAISISQSLDRAVLAINLPHDSVIAEQYRLYPPTVPITVTIFRGQEGEDTPIPIWVGRVIWGDFQSDLSIRLECEPITTGFKRVGLHLHYQHICPHVLYDTKTCKAAKQSRSERASNVAGNIVDFAAGTSGSSFRFAGGTIEFIKDGIRHTRTIFRKEDIGDVVASTRLYLIGTVEDVMRTGDDFTILRGCARTLAECNTVFNNSINFGGFPFIPSDDPTSTSRVFY